jgi:hypothetical protein
VSRYPPPSIPAPRQSSPLRVLAGGALVAVTIAAVLVSVLSVRLLGTAGDVDRVVAKADRVADDAERSVNRLDRSTRDLDPAVRELRRAARALEQLGARAGTVSP